MEEAVERELQREEPTEVPRRVNKFAIIYGLIALGSMVLAAGLLLAYVPDSSAWSLGVVASSSLAFYVSFSFGAIAFLYMQPAETEPALLLGKSAGSGALPSNSWVIFGAYLLSAHCWWWCRHSWLVRALSARFLPHHRGALENPHDEILPRLHLGRRCAPHELPQGVTMLVDLTAEFPRIAAPVAEYRCLPTLDTLTPAAQAFQRLVADVADEYSQDPRAVVFVHCANGHGRSAAFVAALLIRLGHAASVAEAERFLQQKRSTVRLHRPQRAFLLSLDYSIQY